MSVRMESMLTFIDELGLATGSTVVDAGCGPGYLASQLARRKFRVLALDTSRAMVERARRRLADSGGVVAFQVGSVECLPYRDASVDLLCCAGVLEYLRADQPTLDEIRRVLRPGGHALLSVTNAWSPVGYLDFAVEAGKRLPWLVRVFDRTNPRHPVRPRHFQVRRHRPARFLRSITQAGLDPVREAPFYLLPWPHPFDRLFPRATARFNRRLEQHAGRFLGRIAEGHLVLARRPL